MACPLLEAPSRKPRRNETKDGDVVDKPCARRGASSQCVHGLLNEMNNRVVFFLDVIAVRKFQNDGTRVPIRDLLFGKKEFTTRYNYLLANFDANIFLAAQYAAEELAIFFHHEIMVSLDERL